MQTCQINVFNNTLAKNGKRSIYFRNMQYGMLTTVSFLKSERSVIKKTRQWHLEAESNLIYLTLRNKSLFF